MSTDIPFRAASGGSHTGRESPTSHHCVSVFHSQSTVLSTLIARYDPRRAALVSTMTQNLVRPFEHARIPLAVLSPRARTMLLTASLTALVSSPVDLVVAEVPPFRPIGSTTWHPWQKHVPFLCSLTFGFYVVDLLSLVSQVETALTPQGVLALFLTDSRHGDQYYSPSAKLITAMGPHRIEGVLPVRCHEDSVQKEDSSAISALIPMVHHVCVVVCGVSAVAAFRYGNAGDPLTTIALAERPPAQCGELFSPMPAAACGRQTVRVGR